MGQRLRTVTPMGDWRTLRGICDASDGYSQYDLILLHETVGMVYVEDVDNIGDEFVLFYHAEKIIVDKLVGSGEIFRAGDAVYWSGINGTGVSPNWQSGWYWIGIATEPADVNDTIVEIDLKGDKATIGVAT